MTKVRLERLTGDRLKTHLPELARLRITVFRDFPYLYDGSPDYEERYLRTYAAAADSVIVGAFDGERVVGASTGLPLEHEPESLKTPFAERGYRPEEIFYFGESVLLPEYRGRGIGHAFFDHREAHARGLGGFRWTAFAAVDRDPGDPRRPADYRGNDAFWAKRGYERRPGMTMHLEWNEVGVGGISHPLTFWLRPLEQDG